MKRKARRVLRLDDWTEKLYLNGTSVIARCDATVESVKPLPSLCSSYAGICKDDLRLVCDKMTMLSENTSGQTLVHVVDSVSLVVPESFFHQHLHEFLSKQYVFEMNDGQVEYTYISGSGWKASEFIATDTSGISVAPKFPSTNAKKLLLRKKRRLAATGKVSVLILRVATEDEKVTLSHLEITNAFFSSSNPNSFRGQYKNCSGELLTFDPIDPVSPVTDIQLIAPSASFTRDSIRLAAQRAAESYFNVSDIEQFADHVIYCLPPGLEGDRFYASSAVGYFWVVANNTACGDTATMMHEMGHNFGLGHAWQGPMEYGDETSLMGATSDLGVPSRCFNGQNIWRLGWFPDNSVEIMPQYGPRRVSLASFVDYKRIGEDQNAVVKVADVFLVYNRATSFNVGTGEFRDNVTIVKEVGLHSHLLGGIDSSNRVFKYMENDTLWNMTSSANDTLWNMSHWQSPNSTAEPIYIHICDIVNETNTTAQALIVAIGFDPYPCSATNLQTNPPSRTPSVSPSIKKPTSFPFIDSSASSSHKPSVVIAEADMSGPPTSSPNLNGGSSLRALDDKVGYVLLGTIVLASVGAIVLFTVLLRVIRRRRLREEEESYIADVIDCLESCEPCERPQHSGV